MNIEYVLLLKLIATVLVTLNMGVLAIFFSRKECRKELFSRWNFFAMVDVAIILFIGFIIYSNSWK